MKLLFLILTVFIYLISIIKCDYEIGVIIYDHKADGKDFEGGGSGAMMGLVGPIGTPLLPDRTPPDEYSYGRVDMLSRWFYSVPNVSLPLTYKITIDTNTTQGLYQITTYNPNGFFPIDNQGFDDPIKYPDHEIFYDSSVPPKPRNFHFCMVFRSIFTYHTGHNMTVTGDDDIFVYLNDKLALDLGGVHGPLSGKVDFSGLQDGQGYTFDLFQCERHTSQSNFKLVSNFELGCNYTDFCGTCQGLGECCEAEINCDDNDECTWDFCPEPKTQIPFNETISSYCRHDNNLTCFTNYGVLVESMAASDENGGNITLHGKFGIYSEYIGTILIDDSELCIISSINQSVIICSIGKGIGTHKISVKVNDKSWTGTYTYRQLPIPSTTTSNPIDNTIDSNNKESKLSPGAIVGIVIGSVCGLAFIISTGLFIKKAYRKSEELKAKNIEMK